MKIEHLAIWVKDLEKMKSFYTNYFNGKSNEKYTNSKKKFHSYFIQFDSGSRLELMTRFDVQENENNSELPYFGLTHFAISVGSKETVDTMTERFRKDGYRILGEPRTTGDGYYESVILDPENNQIEITI